MKPFDVLKRQAAREPGYILTTLDFILKHPESWGEDITDGTLFNLHTGTVYHEPNTYLGAVRLASCRQIKAFLTTRRVPPQYQAFCADIVEYFDNPNPEDVKLRTWFGVIKIEEPQVPHWLQALWIYSEIYYRKNNHNLAAHIEGYCLNATTVLNL